MTPSINEKLKKSKLGVVCGKTKICVAIYRNVVKTFIKKKKKK